MKRILLPRKLYAVKRYRVDCIGPKARQRLISQGYTRDDGSAL